GTEVGGEVRVVQPLAVAPAEAVRARLRPDRDRGIAVGYETVLVVPRQRADGADRGGAIGIVGAHRAEAAARGPAAVCRLRPRGAAVEREVDAGDADAGRERAGVVGARVARLHVDLVVGP